MILVSLSEPAMLSERELVVVLKHSRSDYGFMCAAALSQFSSSQCLITSEISRELRAVAEIQPGAPISSPQRAAVQIRGDDKVFHI